MGVPLLLQVLEMPATSAVTALLCGVYLAISSRGVGYAEVGLSYEAAVQHLELWRVISGQLSHVELLHLLFNVSSLWSVGVVELGSGSAKSGTLYYLQTSLVLLVFSGVVALLSYHCLAMATRQDHFLKVTCVGYSAVIFGWMTVLASTGAASFSVFGLADVPMWLMPFASLLLTSVLIPRASFVGHVSGIIVGFMVAGGLFDWLTLFWLLTLSAWIAALLIFHMLTSGRLEASWLRLLPPAGGGGDIETGAPPVRIVDGVLQR